jgi:hypothetical protein
MGRNTFLKNLKRAQETKQPAPKGKPISEMSEAKLEVEAKRLHSAIRMAEEEVHLAREELAGRRSTLGDVLRSKPRRPRWK